MFGRAELAELELRKRALVIESEVNRMEFQTEWRQMCDATEWIGRAARFWRQANPWLAALAPMAGVFAARTMRREGGIVRRLLGLVKWIQPLMAVWRSVMGTPAEGVPAKPSDGQTTLPQR